MTKKAPPTSFVKMRTTLLECNPSFHEHVGPHERRVSKRKPYDDDTGERDQLIGARDRLSHASQYHIDYRKQHHKGQCNTGNNVHEFTELLDKPKI
jgi:hypothetical protein